MNKEFKKSVKHYIVFIKNKIKFIILTNKQLVQPVNKN